MAKPRKVLMIAHTFPPFGSVGGSIRLVKYLRYLNREEGGWQPTVITIADSQDLLWLPKDASFSIKEIPSDVRLIRTLTDEPKRPCSGKGGKLCNLMGKIKLALLMPFKSYLLIPDDKLLWGSSLLLAAEQELLNGDYDLIYATAPPFSVLLQAVRLKQKTGLPLILDIKDDWIADERFRGLRFWRRPLESRMESRCIEAADRIITVTNKSCADYRRRYPRIEQKLCTIPNGCDVSEYREYWDDMPAKFDKFTLVHTGIFSARRDLSPFFRAMRRFISDTPCAVGEVAFIIVGRIPRAQARVVEELSLTDIVRNIDYMERDEYVSLLLRSHLPVVINYDVPTLIPGKLYEYWGSRNRMLLLDSANSAAAELVRNHLLGDIVDPSDEDGIFSVLFRSYSAWRQGGLTQPDVDGLEQFDRRYLTGLLELEFNRVAGFS